MDKRFRTLRRPPRIVFARMIHTIYAQMPTHTSTDYQYLIPRNKGANRRWRKEEIFDSHDHSNCYNKTYSKQSDIPQHTQTRAHNCTHNKYTFTHAMATLSTNLFATIATTQSSLFSQSSTKQKQANAPHAPLNEPRSALSKSLGFARSFFKEVFGRGQS